MPGPGYMVGRLVKYCLLNILFMPTRIVRNEFVFNVALKSHTEYDGVIPLAPFAGGSIVFNASE
jgi:hypothetical protein